MSISRSLNKVGHVLHSESVQTARFYHSRRSFSYTLPTVGVPYFADWAKNDLNVLLDDKMPYLTHSQDDILSLYNDVDDLLQQLTVKNLVNPQYVHRANDLLKKVEEANYIAMTGKNEDRASALFQVSVRTQPTVKDQLYIERIIAEVRSNARTLRALLRQTALKAVVHSDIPEDLRARLDLNAFTFKRSLKDFVDRCFTSSSQEEILSPSVRGRE